VYCSAQSVVLLDLPVTDVMSSLPLYLLLRSVAAAGAGATNFI
jgi:hypothetical protein